MNYGRLIREGFAQFKPRELADSIAQMRTAQAQGAERDAANLLPASVEAAKQAGITDIDVLEATEYYKTARGRQPNGATSQLMSFSGAAMAPGLGAPFAGLLLVAAGAIGVIYAAWIVRRIRRWNLGEAPHWSDVWCYAAAPMALYAALAGAGALVWLDRPVAAAACAMVLMLMLLMAIRNAWDLVTWLAPKAVR